MTETSPLVTGLLMTHKIISRGLSTSIAKCDEYLGKQGIPPGEATGFSQYVTTLKWVTHAHHLSEDDIAFPYFKEHFEAPWNRLKDDHQTISRILLRMDQSLLEISNGGLVKLREALGEFEMMWVPHIKIEEERFTSDKVQKIVGMKEQVSLSEKLARHGSKNSGPGPLALPFFFYNLEGSDREAFMTPFPWIVKRVLVPIVWKGQWKPMSPFLLSKS